jgi:hypothetical protein
MRYKEICQPESTQHYGWTSTTVINGILGKTGKMQTIFAVICVIFFSPSPFLSDFNPTEAKKKKNLPSIGRVNYFWPSPTQSISVSGTVGTHDHILVHSKTFTCIEVGPLLQGSDSSRHSLAGPFIPSSSRHTNMCNRSQHESVCRYVISMNTKFKTNLSRLMKEEGSKKRQCFSRYCNVYLRRKSVSKLLLGARGSIVGWGTMLQAGGSQVPFPMRSLDFSINLILPAALWSWGRLSL